MTGIVVCLFVAAACAVSFLTVKRFAGNLGHGDDWWYGWATAIVVLGPAVSGALYFASA